MRRPVLYDCAADELDEHLGPGPRLTIVEKSSRGVFFREENFITIKRAFFLHRYQIKRKKAGAAGVRPEAGEEKGRERRGTERRRKA